MFYESVNSYFILFKFSSCYEVPDACLTDSDMLCYDFRCLFFIVAAVISSMPFCRQNVNICCSFEEYFIK